MTNRIRGAALAAALAAVAGGLGGCAQTSKLLSYLGFDRKEQPRLVIRPKETPVEAAAPASAEDRAYSQAKQAIKARDYATALELLQIAKQRAPNDGRVLNALGVVYDKLGRFDLSRRYYQEALAVQPNSKAVLANLEYSSRLQAYSTRLREEPVGTTLAAAPAFRVVTPPAALRVAEPAYLGSAIRIVDASGDMGLARGVQRHLVANGWSVEAEGSPRVTRDTTVIVYKAEHRRVAEALAHTLPFAAKLQACVADCDGVRLLVGANARIQDRG